MYWCKRMWWRRHTHIYVHFGIPKRLDMIRQNANHLGINLSLGCISLYLGLSILKQNVYARSVHVQVEVRRGSWQRVSPPAARSTYKSRLQPLQLTRWLTWPSWGVGRCMPSSSNISWFVLAVPLRMARQRGRLSANAVRHWWSSNIILLLETNATKKPIIGNDHQSW